MDKKRITTAKTRLNSITSGSFVKQEGYNPSYVLSPGGQKLSRVRLLATVMDKFNSETGKFSAVTLDDGTDTVRAKVFNSLMLQEIEKGDIVDVIGRIKEYNGEIYVAPEIITKSDPDMEILRELELREQDNALKKIRELVMQYRSQTSDVAELSRIMRERHGIDDGVTEAMISMPEQRSEPGREIAKDSVLRLIETMDAGQGCDYSDLLETSQLSEEEMDSVINELLSDGVCFEPKPGKIRKL